MNKRGHCVIALALSFNSFFAVAADQLVWSETFQSFPSFAQVGSINTASVPGGVSDALVTDPLRVKGPNGVEFAGGRVWWPDQQLNRVVSVLAQSPDRWQEILAAPEETLQKRVSLWLVMETFSHITAEESDAEKAELVAMIEGK